VIELVVFDMAGTTVFDGDAVNAAFRGALKTHGIEVDSNLIDSVMGFYKPDAIRILLEASGRPPSPRDIDTLHEEFISLMKEYYETSPDVREIPGAEAVFRTLHRANIKIALNTGFSRDIAAILLHRLGWDDPDIVDATITSDEVPNGRPAPDMIQALMAKLGVDDPQKVAKIGDTMVDLQEGSNAGCLLNIGVTSGSYTREELEKYPHTHILPSIADATEIILSH
jgi:phosphonatase-like hydrolase